MVQCDICGKTFKNRAGLAGHKQFAHEQGERKYFPKNEVLEALEQLTAKIEHLGEQYSSGAADYPSPAELTSTVRQLAETVKHSDEGTKSSLQRVLEGLGTLDKHTRNELRHDIEEINQRLDAMVPKEEERGLDWGTLLLAGLGGWVLGRMIENYLENERRKKAFSQQFLGSSEQGLNQGGQTRLPLEPRIGRERKTF